LAALREVPSQEASQEASEEALMAAYAAGDRSAFDGLFALVAPRVIGFFLRSFSERPVAEDLMQQTFLRLHRIRHLYEVGRPFRPWLFTLAARLRLDELRRRKRWPRPLTEEEWASVSESSADEHPSAKAEEAALSANRAALVQAALAALPESQRGIVHLNRFEGLTYKQIAETLGTSEGAIKLRAFRAYAQLRKKLVAAGEGGEPLPSPGERLAADRGRVL